MLIRITHFMCQFYLVAIADIIIILCETKPIKSHEKHFCANNIRLEFCLVAVRFVVLLSIYIYIFMYRFIQLAVDSSVTGQIFTYETLIHTMFRGTYYMYVSSVFYFFFYYYLESWRDSVHQQSERLYAGKKKEKRQREKRVLFV